MYKKQPPLQVDQSFVEIVIVELRREERIKKIKLTRE